MSLRTSDRFRLQVPEPGSDASDLAREIEEGMRSTPKRIPCRFFYDETGSKLFEEICAQPEYYLTRAEDEILLRRAEEIAKRAPEGCDLVELGSGDAHKTRRLLSALLENRPSLRYVPIDISRSALEGSAQNLLEVHPELEIHGIAAEYERGLTLLHEASSGPKLVLWLGSNVGNLERADAASFLRELGLRHAAGDRLLIGIDLRKDRGVLERAYDDARGVTARFNRNLLVRLNSELAAEFDPERFRHVAFYNEEAGRIEMHLEGETDQVVPIRRLSLDLSLRRGERIHTESSYKYSQAEIEALAAGAGMCVESSWLDSGRLFSLNLFAPLA